jgi:hypothetical protein
MITFQEFIELRKEGDSNTLVLRSKRRLLLERWSRISPYVDERTSLAVDGSDTLTAIPLL